MAVIGLIGPHAVGKTVAARRWLTRYSGLTLAIADDQWEETQLGKVRVREWKGTKEEKQARAFYHLNRDGVTLIESARGFSTWLSVFRPTDPVIVLTCLEPTGRAWIEDRRKRNGNSKPLSNYWTAKRLDYECNGHLLNYVRKLHPTQVKHFVITDRERDWPAVDAYFGSLYRRINNELNRKRRASNGS